MKNKRNRKRLIDDYEVHKQIYIMMAEAHINDLKLLNPVCFYWGRVRRIILVNEKIPPFPFYSYKRYISTKPNLKHKYLYFLKASKHEFESDNSVKHKHECDASYISILRVVRKSLKYHLKNTPSV
jgi:hypothetical protein